MSISKINKCFYLQCGGCFLHSSRRLIFRGSNFCRSKTFMEIFTFNNNQHIIPPSRLQICTYCDKSKTWLYGVKVVLCLYSMVRFKKKHLVTIVYLLISDMSYAGREVKIVKTPTQLSFITCDKP